jgi:hypothetical protein
MIDMTIAYHRANRVDMTSLVEERQSEVTLTWKCEGNAAVGEEVDNNCGCMENYMTVGLHCCFVVCDCHEGIWH